MSDRYLIEAHGGSLNSWHTIDRQSGLVQAVELAAVLRERLGQPVRVTREQYQCARCSEGTVYRPNYLCRGCSND